MKPVEKVLDRLQGARGSNGSWKLSVRLTKTESRACPSPKETTAGR